MRKMCQVGLLGIIEILQQGAGCNHTHGKILDSKPCQSTYFKMSKQYLFTAFVIKHMRFQCIDGNVISSAQFFHFISADQECFITDDL